MPSTVYGTGRKRRDDILNRVMDTIYKGQAIPLGGHFNPAVMQKLMSATQIASAQLIDRANVVTGQRLFTCGLSKCNSSDVCG
jgi:hypothetical protein